MRKPVDVAFQQHCIDQTICFVHFFDRRSAFAIRLVHNAAKETTAYRGAACLTDAGSSQ